jgi:hypothetical protein
MKSKKYWIAKLKSVLWVRDILVRIRIYWIAKLKSMLWIGDILVRTRIRASDPDPAIFVFDLQDANKELFFSAYYFLKVHLHHFSKKKVVKNSQNSRNQGFSYYICLRIEGSGSVSLSNGSESGS